MIRKIVFTLLFAIVPVGLMAQHWQFKVGGGISKLTPGTDAVGAWTIGAGYEWEFDQNWTFAPSLLYTSRGWEFPNEAVVQKDEAGQPILNPETGDPLMGWKNTSSTAHYLELPLLINYYLRTQERQYIVFTAGPYAALGVGGKTKVKGDTDRQGAERFFYDYSTFSAPGAHRFDVGFRAGLGYQFSNGITASCEFSKAFTEVLPGHRNMALQLSLSYTFKVGSIN